MEIDKFKARLEKLFLSFSSELGAFKDWSDKMVMGYTETPEGFYQRSSFSVKIAERRCVVVCDIDYSLMVITFDVVGCDFRESSPFTLDGRVAGVSSLYKFLSGKVKISQYEVDVMVELSNNLECYTLGVSGIVAKHK